jgi:hypothetical protein
VYPDPRDDDYIFPSASGARHERTKPICVSYVNRIIKKIAHEAGIGRRISTYLLRHTRLTEIQKLGIKGVEFKKFAGHAAGSRQESVYVHLDNEDMKRSVLEKVYKISDEITKVRGYEERIKVLETQLKEVLDYLKESRDVLGKAQEELEIQSENRRGMS